SVDVPRVRHVGADRHRAPAVRGDAPHDVVRGLRLLAVVHHYGRAVARESLRDGPADAPRSAGHERNTLGQHALLSSPARNAERAHAVRRGGGTPAWLEPRWRVTVGRPVPG